MAGAGWPMKRGCEGLDRPVLRLDSTLGREQLRDAVLDWEPVT